MSEKVEYGVTEVELSRPYPFGKKKEIEVGKSKKTITVLSLTELNGHDNVSISRESEKGKLVGYLQIASSAGIDYDDALSLADKDSDKVLKELTNF